MLQRVIGRIIRVYTGRSSPQPVGAIVAATVAETITVYTLQATGRRDDRSDCRGDNRLVYTPYYMLSPVRPSVRLSVSVCLSHGWISRRRL